MLPPHDSLHMSTEITSIVDYAEWLAAHHTTVANAGKHGETYHVFAVTGSPPFEAQDQWSVNVGISVGPLILQLLGFIDLSSLAADISTSLEFPIFPAVKVGKLQGNLNDGITIVFDIPQDSGSVTVYVKGTWLWIEFKLTIFETSYQAEFRVIPLPTDERDRLEEVKPTSEIAIEKSPPPFRKTGQIDNEGGVVYSWAITEDECARLTRLFGRDFYECDVGGTLVTSPPRPCAHCGKWTEFIDWVYTAIERDVHKPIFIFNALRDRKFPKENLHDVYCSGCGKLTHLRARNNTEGAKLDIRAAGPLRVTSYDA